jgi:hypothetical protein
MVFLIKKLTDVSGLAWEVTATLREKKIDVEVA